MIRSLLLVLAVALAAPAPIASAQPAATTAPTAAQRQRARELYGQGQAHFQAERYVEAQAAFEQAYAQVPNPVVLLGVASAQERLGRAQDAARTLRRYLRERPDAPDRAEIEGRIAQLDPTGATAESASGAAAEPATGQGTIRVDCTPEGATIAIDGQDTGRTAPAEIEVPAGEHEITLQLPGYQAISRTVTVAPGGTSELTLQLAAEGEPGPMGEEDVLGTEGAETTTETTTEMSTEATPTDTGPSAGVWVTTAIAGVALVTGTVFGFLALSAQSDFDANPAADVADRGETFALVADLAFGVAIAAGVTAIVLYATERPSAPAETITETTTETETEVETETETETTEGGEVAPPETTSRREQGPRLTVAPWGAPTGGGAAMQVTF